MKKVVITGFSGFVSSHFLDYLYENHPEYEVYGMSLETPRFNYEKYNDKMQVHFFKLDLMDNNRLHDLLYEIKPDYVLHLAAFSSVAYSWQFPEESFINNCNIFLNLMDTIRSVSPKCRILSVGSSEEYGNVLHEKIPIREEQPLNPQSPYAVARVSQELLSKVYVDAFNMQIIMTRSFNHIGPRQDDRFVIPSFIKRILEIKSNGLSEGEIETGDLSIIRDFVDVRDVVEAYYLLLINGIPGEVYNVCSGEGLVLSDIVDIIADEVGVTVTTKQNSSLVRPSDNPEIIGSPHKIENELGWTRKWKFKDTIREMVSFYQNGYEENSDHRC